MRELTAVPERGWAIEREEGNIGVSCVAAPIFGPLGDVAAALSVTGPSQLVRADRIGPAVRMAAAAASRPKSNVDPLILQSTEAGHALYRRMGFRDVTKFTVYLTR